MAAATTAAATAPPMGPSTAAPDGGAWDDGAHRRLLDIDAAWRLARTDLRVEGLVQLATLLDQSPSPAVVNSAFVKLFDYWRSCTGNAMRPILALVIRKCARHAESIVAGRDEVVRRILAVLDSNDPCARSLTLLVVGHLAPVFRDKPDAQYTVYRELKSKSASELAAATYAVDRLWPVRRSQSSLQSLDTIVAAIRLAEQLDDQGHLALRLSNVLRNSDHEYTIAVKAFHSCTMLLNRSKNDNSADAAVRSVSLQKTLASLAQKFPAFLPRVIAQSLSMLRTSLHTTAAPPSATMEDAHLHNDKQIDGIYAQSIGAIDSLLGIAHTHPHFFQPLDVVSVADLLLGWTGQKDQHDRHSQQPPHDGLVRMQAKTSRLLSRLAAHPFLLIDAVRKHGLADRIAAFYAGIASLIRLTLQASIVLDVAKTALAAVRIEPECLEQAQANIHWSLDRIFRKLAVLDTSADQDAFSRLVYAYWCMCQTQMQGVCIESLKALLTNHKAVFVIGKIWSQSTDPDSDLSFVPDLLARFIDSDLDVFEPRQMMPLLQTMLCTAGVSNAAQIATIEIKLSSAGQDWLSVPGGCWWIFELVKEQLVSGIVVPSSSLFDLMLPMIDAPNVVAWLTATKYMGQASISLSQCRSRLGQFAAELQKAVTALESAASQLRLCSSLGMPRPFQLAFIGLLIALLAIMRRIDVRPSMAMYSARDLRRLAERFRQLPHHHYGIDEESEAVLAWYSMVCSALAKLGESDQAVKSGPAVDPCLASIVGQLSDYLAANPGGYRTTRRLASLLDHARSVSNRPHGSVWDVVLMYRPVPRYFFVSRGPVPFKIKVSPLPKANHDLVLRRKTLLVLQFEGYVGAGTAKSAGMEDTGKGAAASATNGAQGSASRRAVRMQPRHAMSRGTAPMRLSFNIKAVAPDTHAVISQSSVSCSIQPSTGYFTGTCPLATDTLPTKFQVFVTATLVAGSGEPEAKTVTPWKTSTWQLNQQSFSCRLID